VTYTYDEAYEASLEWFGGDELAAGVFVSKYALRDAEGNLLEKTPDEMHSRLASEFARIEANYGNTPEGMAESALKLELGDIREMLSSWDEHLGRRVFGEVVPQGSPMAGIGNNHKMLSLSNCFVIEAPHDSYAGILHSDQEQAQIMKRRGGVGFDLSNIRPGGVTVANAAGTSDGIEIFMDRYSNTTREVAQNGRRGALMLTISVHHPEVDKFINIKQQLDRVTGANISVRTTDDFMRAVKAGETYTQYWPCTPGLAPEEYEICREVDAREIWSQMMQAAWKSAEPGVLFWDTIKERSPADIYAEEGYSTQSTNPCGEIVLSPYDSCRLMVVNLSRFVRDPFTENASFDWGAYGKAVYNTQRLMDDMIDLEIEKVDAIITKVQADPEPEHVKRIELELWQKIRKAAINGRRTGTGITALGDVIAAMGMTYGSAESVEFTEEVYKQLKLNAYKSTIDMAAERGAFPAFDLERDKQHPFIQEVLDELPQEYVDRYHEFGRRNIALTTTAPTGSVSVLTQTTSGIEPAFMTHYMRRRKINPSDARDKGLTVDFVDDVGDSWTEYTVFHHWFKRYLEVNHPDDVDPKHFDASPYKNGTANDVDWVASVDIQAAAQRHVCHAISKTCNLPNDATVELVSDVYTRAWETGCKGFTIYRDGSRTGVLVSSDDKRDGSEGIITRSAPKRPDELPCEIHHATIKGEKWTILIGLMDGRPYEVLGGLSERIELPRKHTTGKITKKAYKSKNARYDLVIGEGDDQFTVRDLVNAFDNPNHSAFTRTISLSLRHGVPINYLVEQLQKDKDADMFSFSRVVARTLKKYIEDGTEAGNVKMEGCETPDKCQIKYIEGCATCATCGLGACG
jgi:ribonucleoside-diphosphate reductase alpha chain